MHVFPYSPRPHTRAARLPDRVDARCVADRCRRLRGAADELASAFGERYRGCTAGVLAERFDADSGRYQGYTERYLPVRFSAPAGLHGKVVEVMVTDTRSDPAEATWVRGTAAPRGAVRRAAMEMHS